jgi:uncharacterized phage-associated protein
MHCHFDAMKAVQAAAVLLRKERKRMTRLRLLKLLLIADRACIQEMGFPILGSKIVAMDNGPLHSAIYDLIKGIHPAEAIWSKYVMNDGPRDVVLVDEPELSKLSRKEVALLTKVSDDLAQQDDWTISVMTHGFREWKQYYCEGTSTEIPLEAVIDGVGRGHDKEEILQDLRDDEAFEQLFSRHAASQPVA